MTSLYDDDPEDSKPTRAEHFRWPYYGPPGKVTGTLTQALESNHGAKFDTSQPTQGSNDDHQSNTLSLYEKLFDSRPRGLSEKSAWLRELEQNHGKLWYDGFFRWYTATLFRSRFVDKCSWISRFPFAIRHAKWQPTDVYVQALVEGLSRYRAGNAPDLCVGRYNGHIVGVVFNGSALDPPQLGIEDYESRGVQYVHLPMFAGLRVEKLDGDLCVLVLGNIYATTKEFPANDGDWHDTGFVLTVDTAHRRIHRRQKYYFIYKYHGYSAEPHDDGRGRSFVEWKEEKPLQFCNGPAAFTVAAWEGLEDFLKPDELTDNLFEKELADIHFGVRSTKEPNLTRAGYIDKDHPYMPIFPS